MSLWAELAAPHPALWERTLRTFFLPSAECGSRLPRKRWVRLREAPVKERTHQLQHGGAYVLTSVLGTGRAEPLEPRAARRVSGLAQLMIRPPSVSSLQKHRLRLVATDGAFSMDGDIAPLQEICCLASQYGALVFVDECHATGFLGATGR